MPSEIVTGWWCAFWGRWAYEDSCTNDEGYLGIGHAECGLRQ